MANIKKIVKTETERKYIEVPVEKEYFETSDGKCFTDKILALYHQIDLDGELTIWKAYNNMYVLEINTQRKIDGIYIKYIEKFIERKIPFNRSSDEVNIIKHTDIKSGLYYIVFDTVIDTDVCDGYLYFDCELIPFNEAIQKFSSYRNSKPL